MKIKSIREFTQRLQIEWLPDGIKIVTGENVPLVVSTKNELKNLNISYNIFKHLVCLTTIISRRMLHLDLKPLDPIFKNKVKITELVIYTSCVDVYLREQKGTYVSLPLRPQMTEKDIDLLKVEDEVYTYKRKTKVAKILNSSIDTNECLCLGKPLNQTDLNKGACFYHLGTNTINGTQYDSFIYR